MNGKGKVSAIHIVCAYSASLIDSLKNRYGDPIGLTGLTANYDPEEKHYTSYVWGKGKVLASILRNGLFYNELSTKEDVIIISFRSSNPDDFMLKVIDN